MDTTTLTDIEIFKTGTWNGDTYTTKDLQDMVEGFNALKDKVKPPLKLGHDEKQKILKQEGLPSAGWVQSLHRIGDKVVATISDVPKRLARLIQNKQYKRISAEIYPNYESGGQKFKNVLRAVALLGGDIPAIDSLADIESLYSGLQPYRTYDDGQPYKTYTINLTERSDNQMPKLPFKVFVDKEGRKYTTTIGGTRLSVRDWSDYSEADRKFLQEEIEGQVKDNLSSKSREELVNLVIELQARVAELEDELKTKNE